MKHSALEGDNRNARAELAVYPGGAHAFNYFPIVIAEQANARTDVMLARETA